VTAEVVVPLGSIQRRQSVREKLELRVQVLRKWLAFGVPAGMTVPRSLTMAAEWEDARLGISRIGSPNSITRSHATNGPLVQELDALISQLLAQVPVPGGPLKSAADSEMEVLLLDAYSLLGVELAEQDQVLRSDVSQRLARAIKQIQSGEISLAPAEKRGLLRAEVESLEAKLASLGRQWSLDREERLKAETDNVNHKIIRDLDRVAIEKLEAEKAELNRQLRAYKTVSVLRK
jgi:hypothetical protein